jgi:hypothetical protein
LRNWLEIAPVEQRDARWKSVLLGLSKDSTIGQYGCLVTCFAMLAGVDPPAMNRAMISNGAFQSGGCPACASTFDSAKFMPAAPPILDVTNSYPYAPFPAPASARLIKHLKAGNPAILEVDINPNNNTHDMHFVLAVSAYGSGGVDNIVINDPWHGDQTTLVPRYGLNLARALVRVVFYAESPV